MLRGGGNKSRFVVYYYHVDNKLAHRSCAPIIVPKDTFMNYFINVNPKAAKLRGGNNAHSDDLMIQVTNKAFYEACENWPIPYSPDTVYTAEDFEYLEFGLC